mmetsp:Transcript_27180/g.48797  ORF Transcript_27180/g.48797 Transcript_27180/m.48797 type:complete len:335 (+) Transcript_27180:1482-2486(+)
MGFKKWRVVRKTIPTDLLCTICSELLKHPVSCSACKSYLCSDCVFESDRLPQKCPHSDEDIVPVHRLLEQKLNSIQLYCSFKLKGCTALVTLDKVDGHESGCKFSDGEKGEVVGSPSKKLSKTIGSSVCHRGCGRLIAAQEIKEHDCVKYLKTVVSTRNVELIEVADELNFKLTQLQEVEKNRVLFSNTVGTEIETLRAQLSFLQDERDSLLHIKKQQSKPQQSRTEIQYKIFKENSVVHMNQYMAASHAEFDKYFKVIIKEVRDYTRKDRRVFYDFEGKTDKTAQRFATSLTPVKPKPKEASRTTLSTLSRSISPMKSRSFYSVPTSPLAKLQ